MTTNWLDYWVIYPALHAVPYVACIMAVLFWLLFFVTIFRELGNPFTDFIDGVKELSDDIKNKRWRSGK